jgi:predicted cupin superfamily sugar epimerase
VQQAEAGAVTEQKAGVEIISHRELQQCQPWQRAFASQHKDSRYYEIVEDTLHPEFHYLYFAVRDCGREIRAIQPSFISFS